MSEGSEPRLTSRQADEARADFAAIADDLELNQGQIARVPTRSETARNTLIAMIGAVCLVLYRGSFTGGCRS